MSSLTQEQRHQITKQLLFEHPDQPWSLETNASGFTQRLLDYWKFFRCEVPSLTGLMHIVLMVLSDHSFAYDQDGKTLVLQQSKGSEVHMIIEELKRRPFHADGVMFELVFSQLKKVQPMRSAS